MILRTESVISKVKASWKNQKLIEKFSWLDKNTLTVIEAKMGYGKTINLANFLEDEYYDRVYWYKLKKSNITELDFWNKLTKILTLEDKSIKEEMDQIVSKLGQEEIEIEDFLEEFCQKIYDILVEDTFWIIDNFDKFSLNVDFLNSFQFFIDLIPSQLHIVIISRGSINIHKFAYWQITGMAMKIEQDLFTLDINQVEDFLINYYQLTLTYEDLERIYNLTEGWIILLDLIANRLTKGFKLDRLLNDGNSFGLIFDYFNYEILNNLTNQEMILKEFLFKTSVLGDFSIEFCNDFLNINNSRALIDKLIKQGVFIFKIDDDVYKYHNLFKSFLISKAKLIYDLKLLKQRAKKIYLQKGNDIDLVDYILENGSKEEIVDMVLNQGQGWLQRGDLSLLERVLSNLSAATIASNAELLTYHGDVYQQKEHFDRAIENYLQAEEILSGTKNKYLIKILFKIAKLYAFFTSNKLPVYLDKLRNFKEEFSKLEVREFLELELVNKLLSGDIHGLNYIIEEAEIDESVYKELKAYIYLFEAKADKAEELFKELESQDKSLSDYLLFYSITLPITYNLLEGNLCTALEYIWSHLKTDCKIVKEFLNYYLTNTLELFGVYDDKSLKAEYDNFIESLSARKIDFSWYKAEAIIKLMVWEAFYGDCDKGIDYCSKALNDLNYNKYSILKGILFRVLGINYYFANKLEAADKYLGIARKELMGLDNKMYLSSTALILAKVNRELGNDKKFYRYLEEGIKLSKENGFDNIFIKSSLGGFRDPNRLIPILLEAKKAKVEEDYVDGLLSKIKLSEYTRAPGYSLRIKTLGGLEIYRGKTKIEDSYWKRKKSKEILKLFLINYGSLLPREKVCNILWPNKDKESAIHSFNVALNSLNKILEPNRGSREDSYFIIKKGHSYGLANTFAYYYDIEVFERFIERGKNSDDELISMNYFKEAIRLYKDDFLIEDLYNEFIIRERERLQQLFLEAANQLMKYYYRQGDYKSTISLANKMLSIDPYFESAYLYKMKGYHQIGRREFSIKTYRKCKEILNEELNIDPNEKIKNYYKHLLI